MASILVKRNPLSAHSVLIPTTLLTCHALPTDWTECLHLLSLLTPTSSTNLPPILQICRNLQDFSPAIIHFPHHFWKLYNLNLCLSLESTCPLPLSEDAGRDILISIKIPLVDWVGSGLKSIFLSSHLLNVCQMVSSLLWTVSDPRHTELAVFHTHLQIGAFLPGTASLQDPHASPRPGAHQSCIFS